MDGAKFIKFYIPIIQVGNRGDKAETNSEIEELRVRESRSQGVMGTKFEGEKRAFFPLISTYHDMLICYHLYSCIIKFYYEPRIP